jgi:hypothetical protein
MQVVLVVVLLHMEAVEAVVQAVLAPQDQVLQVEGMAALVCLTLS